MKVYIGIDCGTTSVKCMAIDEKGTQLALASRVNVTLSPHPGWLEQEPEGWIKSVTEVLAECAAAAGGQVAAIALCGHMSSPVFLDAQRRPLMNCMTVGDGRCAAQSAFLREHYEADFTEATMNLPLPWAVAAKALWFKQTHPELYAKTETMIFAKDYIRYRMTGEVCTEPTDAGNTLLFRRETGEWNTALIERIGLKREMFPPILPSAAVCGTLLPEMAAACSLPAGIPVVCGGADMACSQIGTGCVTDDTLCITLSTSGQVCMRVAAPHPAGRGKLTFHPGVRPDLMYAMGSVFSGGLAVNWCYQLLHNTTRMTREDFKNLDELSRQAGEFAPGGSGITFLPFLTGSGSPYFSEFDKAGFIGLSSSSQPAQMLSAVFEGVSYNIKENVAVFEEMGCRFSKIHMGGGGSKMPEWVQILADVLGADMHQLECSDSSTLGAAMLAVAGANPDTDIVALCQSAVKVGEKIAPRPENTRLHGEYYEIYRQFYAAAHALEKQRRALAEQGTS